MVYVVPDTLDVYVIVKEHIYVEKHARGFRKAKCYYMCVHFTVEVNFQ